MKSKAELRKLYKHRRKSLGTRVRENFSHGIALNCLDFLDSHPEYHDIHIFLPIEKQYEINTLPLLDELFKRGKNVYSSVSSWIDGKMKTVQLQAGMEYVEDSLGIKVPKIPVYIDDSCIDLVFVPLLGVDRKGHRLGYGMGFYDRFLFNLSPSVMKIGLSYFHPEAHIPAEDHDVPLDACIFPDNIIVFND
ncbi:5-formyltetrahydrofolate cyclo-ligase [Negadavirga shengliensis]|uniref:5-formyltetrahydrofolate cyclo-ligase n=1 Tax=Negadavirga shengliensis TaxID=1389218 RepID=A0ABV9T670_9BACT